jgi:hypothetical protein
VDKHEKTNPKLMERTRNILHSKEMSLEESQKVFEHDAETFWFGVEESKEEKGKYNFDEGTIYEDLLLQTHDNSYVDISAVYPGLVSFVGRAGWSPCC